MNLQLVSKVFAKEDNLSDYFTLGVGGDPVSSKYGTPADLVNLITKNLMVVGGVVIIFMVILAGFKFMGDTTKGKEEGLKIIKTTLIGFILMFSAYWIVQIIKVITGADIRLSN